mgnify:FL=1
MLRQPGRLDLRDPGYCGILGAEVSSAPGETLLLVFMTVPQDLEVSGPGVYLVDIEIGSNAEVLIVNGEIEGG